MRKGEGNVGRWLVSNVGRGGKWWCQGWAKDGQHEGRGQRETAAQQGGQHVERRVLLAAPPLFICLLALYVPLQRVTMEGINNNQLNLF